MDLLPVAQRFTLSTAALKRHRSCTPEAPAAPPPSPARVVPLRPTPARRSSPAPAANDDSGGGAALSVLTRCTNLVREIEDLIARAKTDGDANYREKAAILASAKGPLELLARLTGELGADREVVILQSPKWRALEAAIAKALAPYPDAARAVTAALAAVEAA